MANNEQKTQKPGGEAAAKASKQTFIFPNAPGVVVEAENAQEAAEKLKKLGAVK